MPGGKKDRRIPSRLLRDLRAVYSQDESQDSTSGQKLLRELRKSDPERFVARLERAEQNHRSGASREKAADARAGGSAPDAAPVDEKEVRVYDQITRLLADLDAKGWKGNESH
jgi:hypothetical protein